MQIVLSTKIILIMSRKLIKDIVSSHPPKDPMGYLESEIEKLIELSLVEGYTFNRERFNNTMWGNTCVRNSKGNILHFEDDVENALLAGVNPKYTPWHD